MNVMFFQRGKMDGMHFDLYVDSEYASEATDRRSISGVVVMYVGACVLIFSRTQKSVTLSSTEAQYVEMAEGLKDAIFLQNVWSILSFRMLTWSAQRLYGGQRRRNPFGEQPIN